MAGQSRGRAAAQNRAQGGGTVATRDQGQAPAQQGSGRSDIRALFQQMRGEIEAALPRHMDPDRMARVALTVIQQNPQLARCDARTLLGALMTCAQVGLEPGPQGHVYFVPYENRREGRVDLTFILGYQGMIELARRSGLLLSIAAHTIYENELAGINGGRFSVEYGSANRLEHKPIIFGDRGNPVGYYATARLKSPASDATEDVFVVLTREEVDGYRSRSATQRSDKPTGPWNTDYEAMAWKTCIRRLSRWLPQSPELAAAMQHEETVRDDVRGNVVDQAEQVPAETFGDGAGGVLGHAQPDALPVSEPSAAPAPPPADQRPQGEPQQGDDPWAGQGDPSDPDDPWANQ